LENQKLSRNLAKDLIVKAEARLKTFRAQGLKLESTEKLLNDTKKAYDSKNLNRTINNLNELGEKLNRIKKYSVEFSNLALFCHKGIDQASGMEMDVELFKELLEDSHGMFDHEMFEDAIDMAKDCKQKIIDGHFLFITDTVKEIYDQLKDLPKKIISSQDIQRRFNDVDAAIKENDFTLAWTITKQLKEISSEVMEPFLLKIRELAADKIIEFQDEIENARDKCVDLSDAQEIFSEMVERMKKAGRISEFKEIIDYTTAGKHALERALRRKGRLESQIKAVKDEFDPVVTDFNELKIHCAIPSSVEKLVQNAKDDLENGKLDSVTKNIELCREKMDKFRRASEPKIELKFISESLKSDMWNRTRLAVSNKGLASANNVTIRFSGPIETRRIPIIETLSYNSTETLEIGLKPEGAGSLPIDMDIDFIRTLDGRVYHEHQELWLEVAPSGQILGSTPRKSVTVSPQQEPVKYSHSGREDVSCLYCQAIIRKAEPIFKCQCGTIYHLECITNLDICVKCGSDLKQKIRTDSVHK
jgi:hypothetical protein